MTITTFGTRSTAVVDNKLFWEKFTFRVVVWIIVHPKTFESKKWFIHNTEIGSQISTGWVRLLMLQPYVHCMPSVPAVTSLNVDGFDILVKILWKFCAVFSASRHCIFSWNFYVTLVVLSFFIINLSLKKISSSIDKNQSMTLPLNQSR